MEITQKSLKEQKKHPKTSVFRAFYGEITKKKENFSRTKLITQRYEKRKF